MKYKFSEYDKRHDRPTKSFLGRLSKDGVTMVIVGSLAFRADLFESVKHSGEYVMVTLTTGSSFFEFVPKGYSLGQIQKHILDALVEASSSPENLKL